MFLELQPLNLQTFTFYFAFIEARTLHRIWHCRQGITYIQAAVEKWKSRPPPPAQPLCISRNISNALVHSSAVSASKDVRQLNYAETERGRRREKWPVKQLSRARAASHSPVLFLSDVQCLPSFLPSFLPRLARSIKCNLCRQKASVRGYE